jgi:hypothetical protein
VFELEKRNRGVRWAAVFAPVQDDDAAVEELDTEVPELMSEEQVAQATERLERWYEGTPIAVAVEKEEEMEFDDDPAFSGGVVDPIAAITVGTKVAFTCIEETPSGWEVT